jgi:hypothetical protein
VVFERTIAGLEQRMAAAVTGRAVAERARLAAESQAERLAAAERERGEAERGFAGIAAGRAVQRVGSGAGLLNEGEIAGFLLRRAEGRLAAAIALGGGGHEYEHEYVHAHAHDHDHEHAQEQEQEQAVLGEARARLALALGAGPGKRLRLAEQALGLAERALGAARTYGSPPGPAQALDLLERARERGFNAEVSAAGVLIRGANAFVATGVGPTPAMQRRLQLLRESLPAYPHGSIQIACSATGSSRTELELARARASRLVDFLAQSVERARLQLDDSPPGPSEPAELRLLFTAYAVAAPSQPKIP